MSPVIKIKVYICYISALDMVKIIAPRVVPYADSWLLVLYVGESLFVFDVRISCRSMRGVTFTDAKSRLFGFSYSNIFGSGEILKAFISRL
jgi:hypothetical protein